MSVSGTPQTGQSAYSPPIVGGAGQPARVPTQSQPYASPAQPVVRASTFDTFQRAQATPTIKTSLVHSFKTLYLHPIRSLRASRKLGALPQAGEGHLQRIKMYNTLYGALDHEGRQHLRTLLKNGVLNDAQTDDGHSTLYQLYAMLTTPRAAGLSGEKLLKETVRILHKPYTITQKFAPLSENTAQQILQVRNNPGLARAGEKPATQPITWQDLNVDASATCVASSVMYYVADKSPGELARQLNELTSPMGAFHEKVKLSELSPEDPQQAYQILRDQNIRFYPSGADEVTVRVDMPAAGLLRTLNSNQMDTNGNVRSGIETAYQTAITYMATKSYDPATDMRDSEDPNEMSKGLTEQEKTLMQNIIKDNGAVQSVTYQAVGPKQNPAPGQEGTPFLYGYTRPFEQTASDIIESLKMGEPVIIGITDTDETGAIAGGHEITITGADRDKNGELKFMVVDSDDDVPAPVVRSARELIPRIHHAGLPLQLAQRVNGEINNTAHYFAPDQNDQAQFDPIPFVNEPMPLEDTQPQEQQAAAPQQLQATQPAQPAPTQQAAIPQQPAASPQQQYVVDYLPVFNPAGSPYYPQAFYPPMPAGYPGIPQPAVNPPLSNVAAS